MTGWLLSTLVATSGLTLLVLLVREPVRKRFGSRATYGLWLIPAARLFMPTLTHTVERRVPAAAALQPIADPLVRESLWMARVTPPEPSLLDRIGGWPALVVILWFAVAAGLFLSRMIAFHRDRRAILASSTCVDRIGSVQIVRSPEIASPVALGILDRLIAVPSDFERLYDARERRLVLEHELAHHRSGDLVANLFAFVLLCLQWFNPLAWVAHAAFRFDQEAACDARVLDEATAADRGDYGRAIAKAASGRALLFASALDRRNTLKRRLQSMLRNTNPNRLIAGRLLVITAIAAALPLTASRAINYLDIPTPPRPVAALPATAAVAPLASAAVVATEPVPVAQPVAAAKRTAPVQASAAAPADARPTPLSTYKLTTGDGKQFTILGAAVAPSAAYNIVSADGQHYIVRGAPPQQFEIRGNGETFVINGKTKRWEELTPAEKIEVRRAVAKATDALARTQIDQARITQDIARIPDRAQMAQMAQRLARTQADLAASVHRMDEQAARAREAGREPDQLEAAIRATLQSVQAIDLTAATRSLATVDRDKIAADVAHAQSSMDAAKAELARIRARVDADQQR
ncbi:MAG TPA: M56 family metallopeptidase [Sphingomicrobium sp.]|nr:M56 family metallopeptidase [Sphingomicrobium sp.]